MRRNIRKYEGNFSANWEGPFKVQGATWNGAYWLEYLLKKVAVDVECVTS